MLAETVAEMRLKRGKKLLDRASPKTKKRIEEMADGPEKDNALRWLANHVAGRWRR